MAQVRVGVRDSSGRFTETFEVFAKLPGTGSLVPMNGVRHSTTGAQLKSLVELVCGIPSDLQLLSYGHHAALTDGDTLGGLRVLPGARIPVKIVYGYDGLVDAALRGDLKEVLLRVAATGDPEGMARRRFVAMFIAAQRGYHYLVDRMLCEGADPDTQTPSGRTALHVAGAMGNSGCLDSLLQHGASLDIKDVSGKTPTDAAASCGQQSIQRRLVLYTRILANKVTREKLCSWPTSPRFPRSKLGSSMMPTLSLQDLAISSGPELMITNWKGREHHHQFLGKRPRSAKSSLFQNDSSTSSTESWSSLKSAKKDQQPPASVESSKESSGEQVPQPETQDNEPTLTRSVRLHDRPKSALSSVGRQDRVKSPTHKSVKFAFHETHTPSSSMSKYFNYIGSTAASPTEYSTQTFSHAFSLTSSSHGQFGDNDRHKSIICTTTPMKDKREERSFPKRNKSETLSGKSRFVEQTNGSLKDNTVPDDMPPDTSNQSSKDLDLIGANDMRINYLNDKLRATIDLPVQHPQRLEFMNEERKNPVRSSFPTEKTRKPTPEENEQAFNDWLASKTQDARDRKLVNRVSKMLDDAFSKKDETLIVDEDEDQVQKKRLLKFEAWSENKAKQEKRQSAKLAAAMSAKQEQRKKDQLAARLGSGTTVEEWLADKVKKQRQDRLAEKQREVERQQQKAEREKAAQDVFQKWCMQKEWEELQMLKGTTSRSKRRPKSGCSARGRVPGVPASSRRTRAHSAPPRRQPLHSV